MTICSWLRGHRTPDGAHVMVPHPRSEVADALLKVESLEARADMVVQSLEGRQSRNHWGETVAAIARREPRHVAGDF